ncbi:hypothetical protein GW17_00061448, partial [Ensete ventricosum]
RPPCPRATAPAGRHRSRRRHLHGCRPCGRRPLLVVLRAAALADGASALKRSSCEGRTHNRSPAYRLAVGGCLHLPQPSRPLQGALAIANRLCRGLALVNAPADGLAIAGCPCKQTTCRWLSLNPQAVLPSPLIVATNE